MPAAQLHLVTSFVNENPFSGSQCAVVMMEETDARFEDYNWLDGLSSNFNLPATAFLRPKGLGEELEYDLRWFASGELPFCGHGTLAAANTVFDYFPQRNEITFHAKPGRLTATRVGQNIQLRVPGLAIDHEIPLDTVELVAALTSVTSLKPSDVINTATFAWGGRCVIFELSPECDLAKQDVNGAKLSVLGAPMIILTQRTREDKASINLSSRVFLPDAPMVEDPITGSAHTALTCYFSTHPFPLSTITAGSENECSRSFDINATQLSKRGGKMKTRYEPGSVIITGKASQWGQGSL